MNITDLITDRMHENLKPGDINEFEKYRWLVEMIATEHHANQAKDNEVLDIVSKPVTKENKPRLYEEGYMNSGLSTKDILSMISENQLKLFNEIQKNAC